MRRLILFMTLCLLILPAAEGWAANFSDTKGHWALQAIDECAATGIIEGYSGNIFKPESPVSHLESLVMIIKSTGLDKQIKEVDLKNGEYTFPADITWGKEYLAVAADNAIINKEKMNYLKINAPTTRAEIAVLFVNALHLTGDAADLTFSDNDQIPESFKASAAAIVKEGIMQGLPGNKFEPNRTVTRAEVVTIISRLLEKGLTNPYPDNYLAGKIKGIDQANRLLSFQKSEGTDYPYIISSNCLFYKDGKKAELSDFSIDDTVRIILDEKKQVKYMAAIVAVVQATQNDDTASNSGLDSFLIPDNNPNESINTGTPGNEQVDNTIFNGILESIILGNPVKLVISGVNNNTVLYTVDPQVKITYNGITENINWLTPQSVISFEHVGGNITAIKVLILNIK